MGKVAKKNTRVEGIERRADVYVFEYAQKNKVSSFGFAKNALCIVHVRRRILVHTHVA